MASVFCEHGRVKTTCPACKPRPAAERAAEPVELPSGRAPAPLAREAEPVGDAPVRGPGKPLLPQRRRKRAATRDEAENADPWWVRKS